MRKEKIISELASRVKNEMASGSSLGAAISIVFNQKWAHGVPGSYGTASSLREQVRLRVLESKQETKPRIDSRVMDDAIKHELFHKKRHTDY